MPLAHELLDWLRAPGWRGHLLALIAGALTTLSFTPFDIWPLGLLSIALLYQGLQRLEGRQALWRGWCWGLGRSEEHTSELQSRPHLVCRLLLEKKKDLGLPMYRYRYLG